MPTHSPIVIIHLTFLGSFLLVAVAAREKAIGTICWWIGFTSATLFSTGLGVLLGLLALSRGGFIHPLAFAGDYAIALGGYGTLAALFWALKPSRRINLPQRIMAVFGVGLLTTAWFFSPQILCRSLVMMVATPQGNPIPGAKVSFKSERKEPEKTVVTDVKGQAVIPLPYMATITAQVSADGYGGHLIFIAPNQRTSGVGLTIIQQSETRFLGGLPSVGGMFLFTTPLVTSPRVEVYLQRIGEGVALPHKPLANLADHLKEAQRVAAAKGTRYPVVLPSGDIFNPEMKAQSPDAYRQFSAVIDVYDPKGPLKHYAADYWSYFLQDNAEYEAQRKRIESMPDNNPDKTINTVILAGLLGENVRELSAPAGLAKIARRLENDRQRLRELTETIGK